MKHPLLLLPLVLAACNLNFNGPVTGVNGPINAKVDVNTPLASSSTPAPSSSATSQVPGSRIAIEQPFYATSAAPVGGVYRRGETFRLPQDASITAIAIRLAVGTGRADSVLSLSMLDASGLPMGPILASASIPGSEVPTYFDEKWTIVSFPTPYEASASLRYAWIISADSAPDGVLKLGGGDDRYPDGGDLSSPSGLISGALWAKGPADLAFQIFVK